MKAVFEKESVVSTSLCDFSGRLGHAAAFSLFMDLAGMHADELGVGAQAMFRRALFWLTVKTRILYLRRPQMGERVFLRTWPSPAERIRCIRNYEVRDPAGILLLCGKTEWAVLDTGTQAVRPMAGVYPEDLDFELALACPEPFARIPDKYVGVEPYAEYRVRSTDIDIGGHMNNAAYVHTLIGSFSSEDIQAMDPHTIDVQFRRPCFEDELLSLQSLPADIGRDIRISRSGETVLLARIS